MKGSAQLDLLTVLRETWRPVPGWPYEVSDLASVRRTEPARGATPGRIIVGSVAADGYRRVTLHRWPDHETFKVARLVAWVFIRERPDGYEINHINGIKTDDRAANLEYVTSSQNKVHAIKLGLTPIGERHPNATLTERDVIEIRSRYVEGYGSTAIARDYPVTERTVRDIIQRNTWKHV